MVPEMVSFNRELIRRKFGLRFFFSSSNGLWFFFVVEFCAVQLVLKMGSFNLESIVERFAVFFRRRTVCGFSLSATMWELHVA